MSGAILLLTACGSGSDNLPQQPSAAEQQVAISDQSSANQDNQQTFSDGGEAWVIIDSSVPNSPSSLSESPSSSTGKSSMPPGNTGGVKGWAPSSASSSSSKGSMATATPFNKIGLLEWEHPTERANGEYLELADIGGYELRYGRDNENYQSIVIPGSKTTFYKIPLIMNGIKGIKVQIAVFDTNGLYSEFVDISPSIN